MLRRPSGSPTWLLAVPFLAACASPAPGDPHGPKPEPAAAAAPPAVHACGAPGSASATSSESLVRTATASSAPPSGQVAPASAAAAGPAPDPAPTRPPVAPSFPAAERWGAASTFDWGQPWSGRVAAPELVSAGGRFWAADGDVWSVPVASGTWQPAGLACRGPFRHVAADGDAVYAGAADGAIWQVAGWGATRQVGRVPAEVRGLAARDGQLFAGTPAGVFDLPTHGGPAVALPAGPQGTSTLVLDGPTLYALEPGRAVWRRPANDGSAPWVRLAGSDGATAVTAREGAVHVGTADGRVLGGCPPGPLWPMLQLPGGPVTALDADRWDVYPVVGKTVYMADFTGVWWSPCDAPLPSPVVSVTILNLNVHTVGTAADGEFDIGR